VLRPRVYSNGPFSGAKNAEMDVGKCDSIKVLSVRTSSDADSNWFIEGDRRDRRLIKFDNPHARTDISNRIRLMDIFLAS
jgi:hypothetical protein